MARTDRPGHGCQRRDDGRSQSWRLDAQRAGERSEAHSGDNASDWLTVGIVDVDLQRWSWLCAGWLPEAHDPCHLWSSLASEGGTTREGDFFVSTRYLLAIISSLVWWNNLDSECFLSRLCCCSWIVGFLALSQERSRRQRANI